MQTVIKQKPIMRAALLHDLCTVGRAALTNILPVLSVMGIEACPVPTMVLSTHTGGFGRPAVQALDSFPSRCAEHLKSQRVSPDAIFVGYLGNEKNIVEAKNFLHAFSPKIVLFDPIMADHGQFYSNFDDTYRELLTELIPFATLMTPNYTESCILVKEPYEEICSFEKFNRIADKLRRLGVVQAVVTSIPLGQNTFAVGIVGEEGEHWLPYHCAGRAYPGTGDLFSAVLLGALMKGKNMEEAVKMAHEFVSGCIQKSDEAGYDTREGILLEPELKKLIGK